ncbi:hypothetical protein KXV30_007930 [Aspergillus fumigatus]|nr:hypothetical protein KXV30_007930 [Aspergillus fumigatus]
MPSFSNDRPFQSPTATATHPRPFDSPQGKPHDKAPVGNTFLWTNWPNGDTNHIESQSGDRHYPSDLKNGSAYSLNGPRSSASSYTRDLPHSKDGSMHSLGNGSVRDPRESGRFSMTMDKDFTRKSSDAGASAGIGSAAGSISSAQQVNGISPSHRTTNGKSLVNGDRPQPSADEVVSQNSAAAANGNTIVASLPEDTSRLASEPDRLAASRTTTPHRYSSPPLPSASADASHPQDPAASSGLRHRHTLQVPRATSARRNSRDQGDETAYSSGRLSPTAGAIRRTSLSLVRRATKTNPADSVPDEANANEDAARWAEAIKQRRASRRKRRDDDDDDRVIVGTKVDQNHVNWVTAYNMLTGIRFTVSRINAKMDRELTPADFEAKHKFSFDITGNELTPSAKYDFKFKDYAPWVFRHLRAKFRLDPADYLMSLTSKYILSELGSPGKSGSFFYFSRDYKYIIKTIHHSEHKLLRKILPEYYKHVEQNPNTLISQFYGLHRVKMAYGRKIHFVVMNNLFPPHRDIHQTFDLKGSTIGRDLREQDLERNPRATLKDLNWLRRGRHLECGPSKRQFFLAQLERDVELLKKLKIMDYSLLLENERKARELRMLIKKERPVPLDKAAAKMPEEILDERQYHVFYADDGGFRATHENGQPGDEIYYLGIIDCLTHYGTVKKLENFFKGLSHDRGQISPIPPESYGDRFVKFIKGITMSKEEVERHREARAQGEASAERTDSVERTMQAAEKEAAKDVSTTHPRTLSTIWDPADANGPGPTSTLPIVDEAGEQSSVGGHSQHSRQGPSLTEKDLPPLPGMGSSQDGPKGKGVSYSGPNGTLSPVASR